MKKYLSFLILFFLIGCSSGTQYFYWDINFPIQKKETVKKSIPVEIILPDYLKSGKILLLKNQKFIFSKYEIPSTPDEFYSRYFINRLSMMGIEAKLYPWDYDYVPKKIYKIRIIDYFVNTDKKEVLLKAVFKNKKMIFKQKYKNDFLNAYKKVYNKLIKKVGGML